MFNSLYLWQVIISIFDYEKVSGSFCLVVLHCVTSGSGLNKLFFGKGTKLIVETSKCFWGYSK